MTCEHCGEHTDRLVEIDDGTGEKIKVCELCLMEIVGNKLVGDEGEPIKDPFSGIDKRYIQ